MRPVILSLMVLSSGFAVADTVYKWVDADGVTHYSDQPHPDAEQIELGSVQTYESPPQPKPVTTAKAAPEAPPYTECAISSPGADEVLQNVSSVTAQLRLDPDLRAGDNAYVAFDGKVMRQISLSGSQFKIAPVYRGTHTIAVIVEDPERRVVCQSSSVTFHVRQASVLSPASPLKPKPPAKPPK